MNVSALPSRFTLIAALLCLVAATAFAQGAQGNLSDMPSVERIKAEIKGSDATDTQARQLAVFTHLVSYVERIKYNRTVKGPYTPEEQKLYDGYRLAAYQTNQDFEKTHTKAEVEAFGHLEGKYEFDTAFTKDWMSRLIGKQSQDTYKGAEAGLAQSYREHEEKLQQQMKKDQGGGGGNGFAGDPVLDPMGIFARGQQNMESDPAIRRCIELGGSIDACEGVSGMEGFASMLFPFGDSKDTGPPPLAGVVLAGNYQGNETPILSFGGGSATLSNCGKLIDNRLDYTLRKVGASVQLTLNNRPRPMVVTVNPNGTLSGPGSILVDGQILIGYDTRTETTMVNGAPAASQGYYCNGPCTRTTSIPIYGPKTERCTVGEMSYVRPKPVEEPKTGIGFLDAMSSSKPLVAGLRMVGEYATPSGLKLNFANDAVTLDCGKAHVNSPYAVENTATGFVVHVQNAGGAFLLAVAPDNTLRGTGSTAVNGRLVTALHNDNVSFAPHSENCAVGTFAANSKRNTMLASNGPAVAASYAAAPQAERVLPSAAPAEVSPAPTSTGVSRTPPATTAPSSATAAKAAMRVLISSASDGSTNPMAGQVVWIMRERMDAVLRSLGAQIPANATPAQAWVAFAMACRGKDCSPVLAQLKTHVVTATKLDEAGKATISTQAAATGTYYLFAQVRTPSGALVWDVPTNFSAGDNSVTLNDKNAELIH
jgi:hypothetical protein